mgnify:CR=1 FL=1
MEWTGCEKTMIGTKENKKEAKNNNESGVIQKKYTKVVKRNMKAKYTIGLMAIIGLVLVAMSTMAVAEEQTIGDIDSYTPGYLEADNSQKYATKEWMQANNWEWTVDWKYNQVVTGQITEVKIRGRTKDDSKPTEYFSLYINGENVGAPTDYISFENSAAGPSSTRKYWVWNDLSVDVDGTVVFEFNKPARSGSPAARIYLGRSGAGSGTDVDNDGDSCASWRLRSPDGKTDGCFAGATEYLNGWWEDVNSDIIYEFTMDDGTSSEPEPEPEPSNVAPDKPKAKSPDDGASIDPNKSNEFVALVNDQDGDDLNVFFYLDDPKELLGYVEADNGIVSIDVDAGAFDHEQTYTWYIQVVENTADGYSKTSNKYSFTTISEPNEEPQVPQSVTDESLDDGDEINVGDTFLLGVPVNDNDGDMINVTFYLNGGAIGYTLVDGGSGDATITIDSSGFNYNASYDWWASLDDGTTTVETEKRTFYTNEQQQAAPNEPETESGEFPWLWIGIIGAIVILWLLYRYRHQIGDGWHRTKGKIKGFVEQKATKKKTQRKEGKAKTGKKAKGKATSKKKTKPVAKRAKQSLKRTKKTIITQISKISIFFGGIKEGALMGYHAAVSNTKIEEVDKSRTVKCPYCGNVSHLKKKEIRGHTRWYCDECGRWRKDLDENQMPITDVESSVESPKSGKATKA